MRATFCSRWPNALAMLHSRGALLIRHCWAARMRLRPAGLPRWGRALRLGPVPQTQRNDASTYMHWGRPQRSHTSTSAPLRPVPMELRARASNSPSDCVALFAHVRTMAANVSWSCASEFMPRWQVSVELRGCLYAAGRHQKSCESACNSSSS